MKLFVVLFALVSASCAAPNGYAYYTPYSAPHSYFYGPSPVSRFAYSVAESAPYVTYASPAFSYPAPAPAVKYVSPGPALVAAPSISVPVIAPAPVKSQYHAQDSFGQARYGHDEPGQSHHAIQDAAGNKYGTFSYIKPDGSVSITQYSADHEGYKVASNDLPVGPGSPAPAEQPAVPVAVPIVADAPVIAQAPVYAPAPVVAAPVYAESDDTIEVENVEYRAKRSNEENKSRAKRSAAPAPVQDTPEVSAAKAAHFAEHEKVRSARQIVVAKSAAFPYAYSAYPYAYSAYPSAYSAYPYAYSSYPYSYSSYGYSSYNPYAYSSYPFAYSGYPFTPAAHAPTVVTADGYLADTPEVAAAKAAHFAEHAAARSRARRSVSPKVKRSPAHTPASTSPLVPAAPVVAVAPAPAVVVPAPGYAPSYTAQVYSRPVDPSVPVVPLVAVPVTTVIKTPAQAYAYKK
uniref:Cuticle protein 7 n=1 Tax=Cacopsylla melanoneura TaxID=428564 RepID=A0A8D8YB59_9HEMI